MGNFKKKLDVQQNSIEREIKRETLSVERKGLEPKYTKWSDDKEN